jgi:hypothetical protein
MKVNEVISTIDTVTDKIQHDNIVVNRNSLGVDWISA